MLGQHACWTEERGQGGAIRAFSRSHNLSSGRGGEGGALLSKCKGGDSVASAGGGMQWGTRCPPLPTARTKQQRVH